MPWLMAYATSDGPELRGQGDDADEHAGQDEHGRIHGQQAGQGEAPALHRRRHLGELDVGLAPFGLALQQEVDTRLQLRRDAAEGQPGLGGAREGRRVRHPCRRTSAHLVWSGRGRGGGR